MFDFDENQTGNPVSDHHSYHFDHFTAICSLQFYVKRLIEGSDLIGLNTELSIDSSVKLCIYVASQYKYSK